VESAWTPRRQGDAGELSAINWLFSAGADVNVPLFTNPDVDLIADFGDRVERVQVKTSTCWRNGRWNVTLCARGGPKYAEYEVEPGEPLRARSPPADAAA
jgi:hypothetical protein